MRTIRLMMFLLLLTSAGVAQVLTKPRVVVLTDIEADPDDTQSLIRLLLYSNQLEIQGLIATTSIHQKNRVAPGRILKTLEAYEKVQTNLNKHESGFPYASLLKNVVREGLAVYGMEGVGEGKDSQGSEWIIKLLEDKDERPLWISVWGGPNTLAQALWKIRATKSAEEARRLYQKLRVYTISDQDDSGPWIRKNFPGIFFIATPGYNYTYATWLGIAFPVPGSDASVVSNEWLAEHIQQGHGPLGAAYPDVAYGMEGDTPAFLNLINNGLSNPEHPDWGGWGGRYSLYLPEFRDSNQGRFKRDNWPRDEKETRPLWTNASDSVVSAVDKQVYFGNWETIWRWRRDFQNDFASRMDWTVKNANEANHPPVPGLAHSDRLTVVSGDTFYLSAEGTTDPDGDSMSYFWFCYKEAGTFRGEVSFKPYAQNLYAIPVTAPKVTREETIHFVLKVTDKGSPALTRYKRVIVTVKPR